LTLHICVASRFRRKVAENCALLGYYAAYSGYSLPKFRDNLYVLSSGVKNPEDDRPLKMKPIGCPETMVRNYHYTPLIAQNSAGHNVRSCYATPKISVVMERGHRERLQRANLESFTAVKFPVLYRLSCWQTKSVWRIGKDVEGTRPVQFEGNWPHVPGRT